MDARRMKTIRKSSKLCRIIGLGEFFVRKIFLTTITFFVSDDDGLTTQMSVFIGTPSPRLRFLPQKLPIFFLLSHRMNRRTHLNDVQM